MAYFVIYIDCNYSVTWICLTLGLLFVLHFFYFFFSDLLPSFGWCFFSYNLFPFTNEGIVPV